MRTISLPGRPARQARPGPFHFNVPLKDGVIAAMAASALLPCQTLTDAGAKVVILRPTSAARAGRPATRWPRWQAPRQAFSGVKVTLATDVVGESRRATVAALGASPCSSVPPPTRGPPGLRSAESWPVVRQARWRLRSDGWCRPPLSAGLRPDIAKLLPSAAGLLVLKEIESPVQGDTAERPYGVVLGGSKVSDKLGVIASLLKKG